MNRLTHERNNGIKSGYWSPNKKDELIERLAAYENTGLSPEQIREMDKLYAEKCRELAEEKKKHRWIPVEERLPDKDDTYLCTLDGKLCGIEEPFTGMCGFENGKWDEPDCVIAWMPLPEPYRPEKLKEAGKPAADHADQDTLMPEA